MKTQRLKHIILLLNVLILSTIAQSQTSRDAVIENIAESLVETMGEASDASEIISQLQYYAQYPLSINKASYNELESLYLLNSKQIKDILHYRTIHGAFLTIYELQAIESIPLQTLKTLSLFITLELPKEETAKAKNSHSVIVRYAKSAPESRGFKTEDLETPKYEGSPSQLYLNYCGAVNRFSWALVGDKDAGESFFAKSNPQGYDFYSAHLQYLNNKNQYIVGDYLVKIGQGLSQWTSYGTRKSSDAVSIKQIGQGIRASSSVDENLYLRGVATTLKIANNFETLGFISYKNRDANVSETDSTICITSLQTSGYHRTENEIEDEKKVGKLTFGAQLSYRFMNHRISAYCTVNRLNKSIVLKDNLYNKPRFRGDQNLNAGIEFLTSAKKMDLFGEFAISKNKALAALIGANLYPSDRLNIAVLYRNYAEDFHTFYGSAFADSDGNKNEHGLYMGATLFTIPHLKISMYSDLYSSPWLKYSTNRPTYGKDVFIQLDYSVGENLSVYVRYKHESNFEEQSGNSWINDDIQQTTQGIRMHVQWQLTEHSTIRARYEQSRYSKVEQSKGWLNYLDYILKYEQFSFYIRGCYFNTENYDSRIYTYENDVPRYSYTPALSGNGLRSYIYTNIKIFNSITAYLKYDITYYFDRDEVGSGYDKIDGSHKSKIKVQLRWKPYFKAKNSLKH